MSGGAHTGSILTIDLDAVAANYQTLRNISGSAEVASVVKANAYGLGVDRVAPVLNDAGCRTFFVANIAEAYELRSLIPSADIHVLDGLMGQPPERFIARNLRPVLNTPDEIETWRSVSAESDRPLPADIQIDTGMARLGLTADEAETLLARPDWNREMVIDCLISHLACAEEPGNPKNGEQRAAFARLMPRFEARRASLSASSGMFLGEDFHFDLTRAGVALYGVNPTPDTANPMAQVIQIQGEILQVRFVDTPQTVGYGATHRITRPSKIATIPIGYADGYPRSLGNTGIAVIGGHKVPVVGRVSMDLTTVDVTDVPDELARPGALVDLLGPDNDLDDTAARAGTIGYEILTRLGNRFERRYIENGNAGSA